jgi:hypothetical protein
MPSEGMSEERLFLLFLLLLAILLGGSRGFLAALF